MSYRFFNTDTQTSSFIDIPNCEITTDDKKYVVKDGEVTVFDVVNGKVKPDSGKQTGQLELNNNQLSVFGAVKSRDNYTDRFDYDDLKNLDDDFKSILRGTYGDKKTTKLKKVKVKANSMRYKIKKRYKINNKKIKETESFEIKMEKPNRKSKFSTTWLGKLFTGKPRAKVMKYKNLQFKYTVKEGETLDSIAKTHDVDKEALIAVNPKRWELNELTVGMKLKIPETKNSKKQNHTVEEGETLESIAKQYNIDIDILKMANQKKLFKSIAEPSANSRINIPESKHKTTVMERNVVTTPQHEYIAEQDKMNAATIANDNDITLYRLQKANPWLEKRAIKAGDKIIIPEHKTVAKVEELNIKSIAEEVGVSEAYIKDILFGIEGRHAEPDLKAYDDMVAPKPLSDEAKNDRTAMGYAIGTPTIGFGHTGRVHGKHMGRDSADWQKVEITKEEAYVILANDIYSAKQDAIAYFGEDFEKAPQSIQDAIIDIIFNKGIAGLERKNSPCLNLKDDLAREDYVSAAADVIVDPTIPGLMKRNTYRVMIATRDLSDEDRQEVLNRVEEYKDNTIKQLKGSNATKLKKDWDTLRANNVAHGFFN